MTRTSSWVSSLCLLSVASFLSVSGCLSLPIPAKYKKGGHTPSPAPTATPAVTPESSPLPEVTHSPLPSSPKKVPPTVRLPPKPTPFPAPVGAKVFLPQWGIAGAPFIVRAWFPQDAKVEVHTDHNLRMGFMGWNRHCPCKEVAITLQNPGVRRLAFYVDGVLAEETSIELRPAMAE